MTIEQSLPEMTAEQLLVPYHHGRGPRLVVKIL